MSQLIIRDQWAGWFQAGTSDKVWAACYTADARYLALWGRRGSSYQTQIKTFVTNFDASIWFRTKLGEKLNKGYQAVGFNDPRYGMIPSFLSGATLAPVAAGQRAGSGGGQLTVTGIVTRARAFIAAARLARTDEAVTRVVLEWKQIAGLAEVFLTIPTLTAQEMGDLRGVLSQMENLVLASLTA